MLMATLIQILSVIYDKTEILMACAFLSLPVMNARKRFDRTELCVGYWGVIPSRLNASD